MSKILILSTSPQRDALINEKLAEELKKLHNEVFISSLPIGGREAILKIEPDVVVMCPIRNHFGMDLATTLERWGVGVVLRHIEPSCDKSDIEDMQKKNEGIWRNVLLYNRPQALSLEIMWSRTEADYFKKTCKPHFPVIAVGAFVADLYKDERVAKRFSNRTEFCKKHGLDPAKKIILISSPWGLLDIAPDHAGDSTAPLKQDVEGKQAWLKMVKELKACGEWDIIATLHPSLAEEGYMDGLSQIGVPVDTTSTATELLVNSDILIHSGSTLAVEMHWLNKPSFQFGDVNSLDMPDGNWWSHKNSAISRVSPFYLNGKDIATAIRSTEPTSNADKAAIEELEAGRYGSMDGKATERAARAINDIDGKFQMKWPYPIKDLSTIYATRHYSMFTYRVSCSVCHEEIWAVRSDYLEKVLATLKIEKPLVMPPSFPCPFCGVRCFSNKFLTMPPETRKI